MFEFRMNHAIETNDTSLESPNPQSLLARRPSTKRELRGCVRTLIHEEVILID